MGSLHLVAHRIAAQARARLATDKAHHACSLRWRNRWCGEWKETILKNHYSTDSDKGALMRICGKAIAIIFIYLFLPTLMYAETPTINDVLGSGSHFVFLQCIMTPISPNNPLVARKELVLYQKNIACRQMSNSRITGFAQGDKILLRQPVPKDLNPELVSHYFSPVPLASFDSSTGYDPSAPSPKGGGVIVQAVGNSITLTQCDSSSIQKLYGLQAGQRFLGSVGSKIFFNAASEPDKLYYYDINNRAHPYTIKLPASGVLTRLEPRDCLIVLGGPTGNSVWALVKYQKKYGFGAPFWLRFLEINTACAKQAVGHEGA